MSQVGECGSGRQSKLQGLDSTAESILQISKRIEELSRSGSSMLFGNTPPEETMSKNQEAIAQGTIEEIQRALYKSINALGNAEIYLQNIVRESAVNRPPEITGGGLSAGTGTYVGQKERRD